MEDIIYSHEQLKGFIKGETIGESFPYDTKDENEVELYIKQLYYWMKWIPNMLCEAEFDHFGSGYASFVQFICYRREDVQIVKDKEKYGVLEYEIKGILINVSRLDLFLLMEKMKEVEPFELKPRNIFHMDEKFSEMMDELLQVLKEFKYEPLEKTYANQVLPFKADIPTIYRELHEYRVLDALFLLGRLRLYRNGK